MTIKNIDDMVELIKQLDTKTKLINGFDCAILGYEIGKRETRVAYSVNHIINKLQHNGMSFLEAVEEFDNKIRNKYEGEGSPIFIYSNNKGL
tara:strand:+ start:515 stop:790 length:276 start_codon:yes stop_codon:yes gene_type:complete